MYEQNVRMQEYKETTRVLYWSLFTHCMVEQFKKLNPNSVISKNNMRNYVNHHHCGLTTSFNHHHHSNNWFTIDMPFVTLPPHDQFY
jgi:hypothetical protein